MRRITFVSLTAIALLLTACQPQIRYDLSPPSFHDKPVISLNVKDIRIVNAYTPDHSKPHVEQYFPTPPLEGVKIWVRDRLRAHGQRRLLEVVIHDAHVYERALETKKGIKGALTKEPSEHYNAAVSVELRIYGDRGALPEAYVSATISVERELLEGTSLDARDALYAEITRTLVYKLDRALQERIDNQLQQYQ